jgi:hypothetical protein
MFTGRRNTLVCEFELNRPRISSYDIQEWLHETMKLHHTDLRMLQIDVTKRHVYVKLRDDTVLQVLMNLNGQAKYKHPTGEISHVTIRKAGTRITGVRIANLAPEILDDSVRHALAKYGEVQDIVHEHWSNAYRYPVLNGIRAAKITLKTHIPSHIILAGQRVLISYGGQPLTCYGCGTTDHLYSACPNRRTQDANGGRQNTRTWANIVAGGQGAQNEGPHVEKSMNSAPLQKQITSALVNTVLETQVITGTDSCPDEKETGPQTTQICTRHSHLTVMYRGAYEIIIHVILFALRTLCLSFLSAWFPVRGVCRVQI